MNDINYPFIRYPADAQRPREYKVQISLKIVGAQELKQHLENAVCELRAMRTSMGHVSGKEVRKLISKIKRARAPLVYRMPAERVLAEIVTKFLGVMNPNKIARLIRRKFARAAARPTRPLVAIKPDFTNLRNVDGKDLDSCFRGQDES